MHMNKAQSRAMNRLTNTIVRFNYDGNVSFKMQDASRGAKWLIATNAESGLRWFEKHIFVMALIGPRGGVSIKEIEGLKAKWLK